MAQVAVPGKMQEYISNIEFSLNFEDTKKSTKVKIGDLVMYDGVTASHLNKMTGQEFSGRAVPLKSAVANNWLTLNVKGAKLDGPISVRTEKTRDNIVYKDADYNAKIGGAFDKFLEQDKETVVAGQHHKVIKEEDQVIKKTDFNGQKTVKAEKRTGKLEVSGDQVDVKTVGSGSSTVSNSTSTGVTNQRAKMQVIRSEDGSADRIISTVRKVASNGSEKPKNSFTVDNTTPKLPSESTIDEVRRITAPVKFDDAQDGQVVRKVSKPHLRMPDEPAEQEGVVLRKTASTKAQVSDGGSTSIADLSGVSTQAEVDAIEKSLEKKESSSKNYTEMLPDDWADLHWVKREKFIQQITDVEFLKFIMKVESTKAIQNACKKRMEELEKQATNG